ncbi:MAG: CCA tRNA nucleotidyltransferase [Ktedonobacteraceae bacterium]
MQIERYALDPWTLQILEESSRYFDQNNTPAYVVGGSVRNLLLNAPGIDWDIVVADNAPALARQLANTLGGFYAYLHEKACRVVVKKGLQEIVFDIAPQQGNTIEADLHTRDFTINAIALPLSNLVNHFTTQAPLSFIDPLHALEDIALHRLRIVTNNVFQYDPLRLLRAVRFKQRYALTLEAQSEQLLTRDAHLLLQAAPERIHEELYAILSLPGAVGQLRFLDAHQLFAVLFPEFTPARGMPQPGLHHWDVFDHSIETVGTLESLAAFFQEGAGEPLLPFQPEARADVQEIRSLLQEAEQQGIFQLAALTSPALKLAALVHDVGKTVTYAVDGAGTITFYHHPQAGVPLAQDISRRLSLNTQDRRLVQQIVAHHMRPGQLSHDQLTERATRRYFVDLGPIGIHVGLISLADHLAMRGPDELTAHWSRHLATVRLLLTRYIRERQRILPPRLLQDDELIHRFDLKPGPIIGRLLEAIAEAQAEGRIHSKTDALWLAEEILRDASQKKLP